MNVIFLDFDGVIDTHYYRSYEQMEEKIKILADICHEYNCKVVIEASAREAIDEETLKIDPEATWVQKIFEWFNKYDIDCIGRTPHIEKRLSEYTYRDMWKEDEIIAYLEEHPEIEHYCVIDDDDRKAMHWESDLDKVRKHLVTTEDFLEDNKELEGLQPYHKEEVGKVLKLENEMKLLIKKY